MGAATRRWQGHKLKGLAETRFGALGRTGYLNLERVQHNALKTVRRTVLLPQLNNQTINHYSQALRFNLSLRKSNLMNDEY